MCLLLLCYGSDDKKYFVINNILSVLVNILWMTEAAALGAAVGIGAVAGALIGAVGEWGPKWGGLSFTAAGRMSVEVERALTSPCAGVGGIVLVPSLIQLPDVELQVAIASSMFAYIAAGLAGGVAFHRQGRIAWADAGWLMLGAAPVRSSLPTGVAAPSLLCCFHALVIWRLPFVV